MVPVYFSLNFLLILLVLYNKGRHFHFIGAEENHTFMITSPVPQVDCKKPCLAPLMPTTQLMLGLQLPGCPSRSLSAALPAGRGPTWSWHSPPGNQEGNLSGFVSCTGLRQRPEMLAQPPLHSVFPSVSARCTTVRPGALSLSSSYRPLSLLSLLESEQNMISPGGKGQKPISEISVF